MSRCCVRWGFAPGLGLLLGLQASSAWAQAVDGGDGETYAAPATERRGGFMAGLGADFGYGLIGGYPNKLGEIDDPAFYREVSGGNSSLSLVLGGALRDWLTCGLLLRAAGGQGEDASVVASNVAIGLRFDAYPMYARGGIWQDLGVAGEFGVGIGSIVNIEDKNDPQILAEGGAMSHLGLGVVYEPWKFWHFSAGPELRYVYQYSQPLSAHLVTLGLRLTFFGVQPSQPRAAQTALQPSAAGQL